jgi:segregation and condensation protein B
MGDCSEGRRIPPETGPAEPILDAHPADAAERASEIEESTADTVSDEELAGHLVALLFAADEPLPVAELARLLDARRAAVERVTRALGERPPPGLLLQRDDDHLQLVTAPASARYIRRLRGLDEHARLSRAALEVLAVVAYRQPATRAEIEAIRGVNGDRALATLLARGLVAEVGRRETVGRPVLFGTTLGFLEHLGLRSLDALPPVPAPAEVESSAGDRPGSAQARDDGA